MASPMSSRKDKHPKTRCSEATCLKMPQRLLHHKLTGSTSLHSAGSTCTASVKQHICFKAGREAHKLLHSVTQTFQISVQTPTGPTTLGSFPGHKKKEKSSLLEISSQTQHHQDLQFFIIHNFSFYLGRTLSMVLNHTIYPLPVSPGTGKQE